MNRDKQIEEMAKIIGDCKSVKDEICDKYLKCADCKASRCYNAGYRKASDIFEEIDKQLAFLKKYGYANQTAQLAFDVIAELKKKYTESEKDK